MTTTEQTTEGVRGALPFATAAFAFLVTMMGTTMPTPIYAFYMQAYGLSQLWVTVIYAIYAGGVVAALLITGTWSDQIGRKPPLFAGLAFALASSLLFAVSHGLGPILLARLLSGLSAGIFASTATAMIMDLVPLGREKLGVLTATAANMGGLGLGPMLAGVVANGAAAPMVTPYLIHVALLCIAGLLLVTVPESVARVARPDLSPQRPALPREVVPAFIPAALLALAAFMVAGFYSAVVPGFLSKVMGLHSPALIGVLTGFFFICSTLGQALATHLPARGQLGQSCAMLIVGVGTVAVAFQGEWLALLTLGTLITGMGHGFVFRSGLGALGQAAPAHRRGGVIALYFVVCYLAISVPVIGVGLLSAALPLKPVSVGFAALSVAFSFAALLWLRRGAVARP